MDQFRERLRQASLVSITYCSRLTNGVAHKLAKLGMSLSREAIWPLSSHVSALDLLQKD